MPSNGSTPNPDEPELKIQYSKNFLCLILKLSCFNLYNKKGGSRGYEPPWGERHLNI